MSTLTAALIVAVLLAVGVPALWWQIRAAAREQARREQFIREHCWPSARRVACAPDNEAGVNLADADECALIYSLPDYDPARERLKKQITTDPYYAATFERIAGDCELAPDLADFADRLLEEIRDDQKGDQA